MSYLVRTKLGLKQSMTPEGYLLCEDVPIARTGMMYYAAGEVPVRPGTDGIVLITRDDMALFDEDTIASFNGKPVVNEHPPRGIDPTNFRVHVIGIVQNARRGSDVDADMLLADLLIMDKDAIAAVRAGKREVSCGYDADYLEIEPGRGVQRKIIGNHVALVRQGRCGGRCSIGDSSMKRKPWTDRIRAAFEERNADDFEACLGDAEGGSGTGGAIHIHTHGYPTFDKTAEKDDEKDDEKENSTTSLDALSKRVDALDEKLGALDSSFGKVNDSISGLLKKFDAFNKDAAGNGNSAKGASTEETPGASKSASTPTGKISAGKDPVKDGNPSADPDDKDDPDEEAKGKKANGKNLERTADTQDSVGLFAEFQQTLANAEVLAPGLTLPTFDAKSTAASTRDRLCAFRKQALTAALTNDTAKQVVAAALNGQDLDGLTCDTAALIFNATASAVKAMNNYKVAGSMATGATGPASPLARMNEENRKFWQGRGGLPN